jgi:hypothetical protein
MEVLQPVGGVMIFVEGYFDESGDLDDPPGIFCVAGYFISTEASGLMDAEWRCVLEEYKLPYFHMVDCAHGSPPFSHLNPTERTEVVKRLIALVKAYTAEGFSVFARADAYEKSEDHPNVYSECASACVSALRRMLEERGIDGSIAYFFEQGHKNKGSAYNHIARGIKRPSDTLTFAAKENVRLLQAADLLAWQSTKYAKDWLYPTVAGAPTKRPPRKDFASLMEHRHIFMHMSMKNSEKTMGIELWPLSERSPTSVDLKIEDDGPILFWREAGDATPIIPVERAVAWRMGGARFAYVKFDGMGDRSFALSFDQQRLIESIVMLMDAMEIYEDRAVAPVLKAESVRVDGDGSQAILRIEMGRGVTLAFRLPAEVLDRLKLELARTGPSAS